MLTCSHKCQICGYVWDCAWPHYTECESWDEARAEGFECQSECQCQIDARERDQCDNRLVDKYFFQAPDWKKRYGAALIARMFRRWGRPRELVKEWEDIAARLEAAAALSN